MDQAKVLVVEDDHDFMRGLCVRLHAAGYQVVSAEDGVSALRTARLERPDLILLDVGLPGGNGVWVLEHLSNLGALSTTPVVVLTGRDPVTTEPAVRRFGIAGFLRKPASNHDLLRTIRRALRGEPDPSDPAAQEDDLDRRALVGDQLM